MPPNGTHSVLIRHFGRWASYSRAEREIRSPWVRGWLQVPWPCHSLYLEGPQGIQLKQKWGWIGTEVSRVCDFSFHEMLLSFQTFTHGPKFKPQWQENTINSFCIPDLLSDPMPDLFSNHVALGELVNLL